MTAFESLRITSLTKQAPSLKRRICAMQISRIGATDLEDLYRSRYSEFIRVASAIADDESHGADAVQEAFARALYSLDAFRGEAPLEAWVWRIVVNTAHTLRRTEQRVRAGEPTAWTGGYDDTHDDDYAVRRLIEALPDRQRTVLFLRYFADLDYRTIADVLAIEVGTVSATLSAARAAVRRDLEEAYT